MAAHVDRYCFVHGFYRNLLLMQQQSTKYLDDTISFVSNERCKRGKAKRVSYGSAAMINSMPL